MIALLAVSQHTRFISHNRPQNQFGQWEQIWCKSSPPRENFENHTSKNYFHWPRQALRVPGHVPHITASPPLNRALLEGSYCSPNLPIILKNSGSFAERFKIRVRHSLNCAALFPMDSQQPAATPFNSVRKEELTLNWFLLSAVKLCQSLIFIYISIPLKDVIANQFHYKLYFSL